MGIDKIGAIREIQLIKKLIKQSQRVGYAPVLALAMAFMFVRTLLAARLLDVPEFGLYGVGVLVSNSFCMFGCFGFYLLLQRNLPMLIAKGCRRRGAIAMDQTLLFAFLGFWVSLPLILAVPFSAPPLFFAISLFNGLAQQIFLVVTLQSRSEGKSMRFSAENLLRATVVLVSIACSGAIFKTASSILLIEGLVTLSMSIWIYATAGKYRAVGWGNSWLLAAKALPKISWGTLLALMGTGIVGFAMQNADRWVAATLLGRDEFALYAFAGIVLILAQSLQSVINVSVFPELAKTYTLIGEAAAAVKAIRCSSLVLLASIIFSLPSYFIINHAVEYLYPKYILTREFMALFLLLAALRLSDFLSSYMIISGRERILLSINIASICLSLALWFSYFGYEVRNLEPTSIAWLGVLVSILNYLSCFLVVFYSIRSER